MQETATLDLCVCYFNFFYINIYSVYKKIKQTALTIFFKKKKEIPNSLGIKRINMCVIDLQLILIQHKSVKQEDWDIIVQCFFFYLQPVELNISRNISPLYETV